MKKRKLVIRPTVSSPFWVNLDPRMMTAHIEPVTKKVAMNYRTPYMTAFLYSISKTS